MNEKINSKTFIRNYGIFLLILIITFLGLIYSVILTRKSWNSGLKASVVAVLAENEPDVWSVGSNIQIKNSMTTNAAAYECTNKVTGDEAKAVIVRTSSFYGPLAGVYIMDANENVTFKGFASLHGRISVTMNKDSSDKRIEYWIKKIPEFVK